MIYFYVDDNFAVYNNSTNHNVFILAGYAISGKNIILIKNEIAEIKKDYNLTPDLPIKYNLKDRALKQVYDQNQKKANLEQLFQFSSTIHDPMLQLADLVSGASCSFLQWCCNEDNTRKKREATLFFPFIAPLIRKCPTKGIFGAGLVLSPVDFKDKVKKLYSEHF